jgi:hypothetical protein
VTLIALALIVPPAAGAQSAPNGLGNPFDPSASTPPPAQTTTAPVQTAPASSSSSQDSGLGTAGSIALFGGGVLVLGAIAYLIMRDARRSNPRKRARAAIATPAPAPPGARGRRQKRARPAARKRRRKAR